MSARAGTVRETTRGFVFWFKREAETVEVYRDDAQEWHMAPNTNAIDVRTQFRIGRWLGPARWTMDEVVRYLGLTRADIGLCRP